jgi:ABC-2 type transport system permease protein
VTETHPTAAQARLRLILTSLLRADFVVLLKNRQSVLLSILLPVLYLVVTSSDRTERRLGGSVYIVGLCITIGLLATSISGYALTVARDREKGVFQRLRVTPAPTWTIMASRLAVQVVANLIIASVVLAVGSAIHHLTLNLSQYGLVLLVSILGGAVFLSIGQAIVGLLKSATTVDAGARVVMIALLLSGLLGASGALGTTLESITKWTPVGTVTTLFSAVLNTAAWTSHDTFALLASAGYIAAFAGVGIRWFQWQAR